MPNRSEQSRVTFAPGVEPPAPRGSRRESILDAERRQARLAVVRYAEALVTTPDPEEAIRNAVTSDFRLQLPGATDVLEGEDAIRALIGIRRHLQRFVPDERVVIKGMQTMRNPSDQGNIRVVAPMEASGVIAKGPNAGQQFTFRAEIDVGVLQSVEIDSLIRQIHANSIENLVFLLQDVDHDNQNY
jgi:hypothetical protein